MASVDVPVALLGYGTVGAAVHRLLEESANIVQQIVMCSWFGNRLIDNPKLRLTAEETWEFCLHGLGH